MEQLEIKADTITAVSTPNGVGGIAVIRVSGTDSIEIVDSAWKGTRLTNVSTHTAHLGKYIARDGSVLDECVATVFRTPSTFTGENIVEISVHGSVWIQREILKDLVIRGCRIAEPGEFTRRAFLNGRIDLAQAEGIADLIASSSKAAHKLAITQTGGAFSRIFEKLREQLIEFASLLELELDFSEEDVEFADRQKMLGLSEKILKEVERLTASYASGSAIKNGVPVVIAGIPNAGKSSLLNLLLSEDKAIVSDIPGTTRDTIEDTIEINGILYRFIDTAGLRDSDDVIENIGISRARERLSKARIVIWMLDPTVDMLPQQKELHRFLTEQPDTHLILLRNKSDLLHSKSLDSLENKPMDTFGDISDSSKSPYVEFVDDNLDFAKDKSIAGKKGDIGTAIEFSTKTGDGLEELKKRLKELTEADYNPDSEIIVTNARHYEALLKGGEALKRAIEGIEAGISGDFIAQDVREAIHHLGAVTGAITTHTLLQSIFSRFCIGK